MQVGARFGIKEGPQILYVQVPIHAKVRTLSMCMYLRPGVIAPGIFLMLNGSSMTRIKSIHNVRGKSQIFVADF